MLAPGRVFAAEAGNQCLRCTLAEQGTVLLSGSLPISLAWKIPLTYAVPFCVTMWGALGTRRR